MKKLNRKTVGLEEKLPVKIIQFGEGNFLRAFIGYAFQELNKKANFNAGIAVVQPIDRGLVKMLNDQDGLYTLFMKGVKKGKEIQEIELIDNIVKGIDPYANFKDYLSLAKEDTLEFIISNTTEAGIAYVSSDTYEMQPPSSFPAKLTVLLHERFKHFKGDKNKGLTIIPCELINHNSETLKEIILKYVSDWNLGDEFKTWLLESNSFHSTLVDRIVPGYPRAEIDAYNAQLDYSDNLIVAAEAFLLWVIEGGDDLKAKLPFDKTSLDVKIVDDMQPFRTRKVRILNGAHTAMVPFSILYGNTTVKESVDNDFTGPFIQKAVFEEISDTLNMDKDELNSFSDEIFDRFRNPFIIHNLSSIALNTVSKFKVRVLPSLLEYVNIHKKLPTNLTFAFASLIRFYKGTFNGQDLPINDSEEIVTNFAKIWESNDYNQIANTVLSNDEYWGEDLTKVENLSNAIAFALAEIDSNGIKSGFENFSKKY
ncbi:altronate oxidoreductase [Polaribacter reichenbachii]|uniref:Altronate oxidoreductase n=1 Tax=Polaribacter reichenbachii TaxID=996801 RepID=A0A1B8TVG0_9FLAO|nr:tagaturonate reductase [Polaribacter reichenbachii]APZ45422.1 altronate oxidoreductase [Polaribacter reichenbachii]AUC19283.1 altronate oxidoreductase [Polaribacter reichenbachii]OBY63562.1 altronate oxidoreductase [Polaribacter reichenbachii]